MDNIQKVVKAILTLKPEAKFAWHGTDITTEEEFNNIEWRTGKDENGFAILTKTIPHSEITFAKFIEEKNKL